MKIILVDDIIEGIVFQVSQKVTDTIRNLSQDGNITGVHFQQGHPLEVIKRLEEMSKGSSEAKFSRYPLVALFRDFPEEKGTQAGIYSEVTLNMIIACRTQPTYNTQQRKAKTFVPILYPIYHELCEALIKCPSFMKQQGVGLRHTKIDHYFWGRESVYGAQANIFKDWIDCIEIKNLKLKVYNKNC